MRKPIILYEKFFNVLNRDVPTPHLIIHLNTSVPTIIKRIKERARSYEKNVEPAYVDLLLKLQNEWISKNPKLHIVSVDTEALDIAKNPEHQKKFIEIVKANLSNLREEPRLRLPFVK